MMNVIKVETKQQLEQAFALRTEVFVDEQNVPIEIEIDEYEEEASHFIVMNDHDETIGAGRLRDVDGDGKVERVCIKQTARRKGIGRLLMNAIEEEAIRTGKTKLILNAQRHAEPFYHLLGYETVSGEFLDAGIPHVKMVKSIS